MKNEKNTPRKAWTSLILLPAGAVSFLTCLDSEIELLLPSVDLLSPDDLLLSDISTVDSRGARGVSR